MGGFGSGRPGGRTKAEHCRSLDANRLHRAGCLAPGYWGTWQWSVDGEATASIALRAEAGALVLDYRVRPWGAVEWEPVRYGGTRPYFRCPDVVNGRPCGRRVAKLYSAERHYLCPHCLRLTYHSHSDTRHDRLLRRRDKLCVKLGGAPGMWLPDRPKGMRRATYERHVETFCRLEEESDVELGRWLARRFPGAAGLAELRALSVGFEEPEQGPASGPPGERRRNPACLSLGRPVG